MDIKVIDQNNIVVDGVEYEAVESDGNCHIEECASKLCSFYNEDCNIICDKIPCDRSYNESICWIKKENPKYPWELLKDWINDKITFETNVLYLKLDITEKTFSKWLKGEQAPNKKNKQIIKGVTEIDWDHQVKLCQEYFNKGNQDIYSLDELKEIIDNTPKKGRIQRISC